MKRKPRMTLRRKWAKFLNGTWTTNAPQEPGTYPLAAPKGDAENPPGILMNVVATEDGLHYALPGRSQTGSCPWGGWFWSQPLPNLPKPPDWNDEQ